MRMRKATEGLIITMSNNKEGLSAAECLGEIKEVLIYLTNRAPVRDPLGEFRYQIPEALLNEMLDLVKQGEKDE